MRYPKNDHPPNVPATVKTIERTVYNVIVLEGPGFFADVAK
jgi:hypothetical protein